MEATGWTPDQLDEIDDERLTRILAKRAVTEFERTGSTALFPEEWRG